MLKAAASRFLKATSWAYTPCRLLRNSLKLMQPNDKIFTTTTLKGKSTLSQPVPHITITQNLDYFENEETFQTKQEPTFLKVKPLDILALKYAARHVQCISQIAADKIDSVARLEQRKMDDEQVIEIVIEAEVPNTNFHKETDQVDQIGLGNMQYNKTADDKGIITLKDAYVETIPQNFPDSEDLENKICKENKEGNVTERKVELHNANIHCIRVVLIDKIRQDNMNSKKTADSERKAALFNTRLLKDNYANIMPLNSYRTEPKLNIKQHNMNNKKKLEFFNAALLRETCAKFMAQDPSNTIDSLSKISQDNIDANKTADSETKAALFNAILLKDAAIKNIELRKDPIDRTGQLKRCVKKTEDRKRLVDVLNDSVAKTPQDSHKIEPIADSGFDNIYCNKAVDNTVQTNFNNDEAHVKNMPLNSTNSKDPTNSNDPASNIINQIKARPIMTFVTLSFLMK